MLMHKEVLSSNLIRLDKWVKAVCSPIKNIFKKLLVVEKNFPDKGTFYANLALTKKNRQVNISKVLSKNTNYYFDLRDLLFWRYK